MELHPILEKDVSPNPDLWYVLSAYGEFPAERVGHTCSYQAGNDGTNGKIYVIGGANPSGTHPTTHVLDLETFTWEIIDAPHPSPRYEHAAFVSESQPNKIFVFGGADRQNNFNDILEFDCSRQKWAGSVPAGGTPPVARTYHTNSPCVGDKLVVYGGGQAGAEPVGDRQVRLFNMTSRQWSTTNPKGDAPKPRHGHLVVAHSNKLYIHGGMAGTHFYDDLHVLDLEKNSWTGYKSKRGWPSGRASHGGVIADGHLFIIGGMSREGALDEFYKLNLETMRWTRIQLEGPPPACRLDFAMCLIKLKVPIVTGETTDDIVGSSLHAHEVIMRSGSASSGRSSAGSQRSGSGSAKIVDVTPANLSGPGGSSSSSSLEQVLGDDPGASANPDAAEGGVEGPCKIAEMLLVVGGMDTAGELFDDCLVYLVREYPHEPAKIPAEDEQ